MTRNVIKELVRYTLLGLGGLIVLPLAALSAVEKRLSHAQFLFQFGAQLVALVPGLPGNFVRAAYYIMTLNTFHPTAIISFGSYFSCREATLGYKAGIGAYCVIGRADIGSRTRLASRVSIISGLHEHGDSAPHGHNPAPHTSRVVIGAEAWLGEGAVVGADVGAKAIVAAGAVVLKPIPPGSLAMGNPARALPQVGKTELQAASPPPRPTDIEA